MILLYFTIPSRFDKSVKELVSPLAGKDMLLLTLKWSYVDTIIKLYSLSKSIKLFYVITKDSSRESRLLIQTPKTKSSIKIVPIPLKIINELKIDYKKFHSLRHTYCTRLFEAGIPIKTVQVLMGHSDIKTTINIYTHVMPEEKLKAVDKLNELF